MNQARLGCNDHSLRPIAHVELRQDAATWVFGTIAVAPAKGETEQLTVTLLG